MASVAWMHLCDYAFLDQGAKPCLIGIFEHIYTTRVPTVHRMASVVAKITGEPGERPNANVRLIGPDRSDPIFDVHVTPFEITAAGSHFSFIALAGVILPNFGPYTFEMLIDGAVAHSLNFELVHPQQQ